MLYPNQLEIKIDQSNNRIYIHYKVIGSKILQIIRRKFTIITYTRKSMQHLVPLFLLDASLLFVVTQYIRKSFYHNIYLVLYTSLVWQIILECKFIDMYFSFYNINITNKILFTLF